MSKPGESQAIENGLKLFEHHNLFKRCSRSELNAFSKFMKSKSYGKGKRIVQEGAIVDAIYFIVKGRVEINKVSENGNEVIPLALLGPGETIGLSETGFFSKTGARQANAIAIEKVEALVLQIEDIPALQKIRPDFLQATQQDVDLFLRMDFIKKIKPFSNLSIDKLRELASAIIEKKIDKNKTIFYENDKSDACYFVVEGKIEISREEKPVASLKKYDIFGETGILLDQPRNATARTVTDCRLFQLNASDLSKVVKLDEGTESGLIKIMRDRSRPKKNQEIVIIPQKNKENESIYILKNGKTNELFELTEEGYFVWEQINGRRTLADITRLFCRRYDEFSPTCLFNLIMDLTNNGFVHIEGYTTHLHEKEKRLPLILRIFKKIPTYMEAFFVFPNVDNWLTKTYPLFRWYFTPTSQTICAAILLLGFATFFLTTQFAVSGFKDIPLVYLWLLYPVSFLSIAIHEYSHAYATKHFGHSVHTMGIGWFWFSPTAFCDTTDILLSTRRRRLIVNIIGIYTQLVITSVILIITYCFFNQTCYSFFWAFALINYINAIYNLSPLIDIDGYYILQDITNEPDIRENAIKWLTNEFSVKDLFKQKKRKKYRYEIIYWLSVLVFIGIIIPFILWLEYHILGQLFGFNNRYIILPLSFLILVIFFVSIWAKIKSME